MDMSSNVDTEGSVATLPIEIIANEILPKVAAKSLVRLKCVSKSYNELISSPEFIDLHLRQSLSSDSNRLLILTGMDYSNLYFFDLDSPGSSAASISLPYTSDKSFGGGFSVLGSINGLVCVTSNISFSRPHLLINPSTGEYRAIPPRRSMFFDWEYLVSFGFEFDDINQDYKLVRVVERFADDEFVYERGVMVYSLKESSWKFGEVIESNGSSTLFKKNVVPVKNYLLHWLFSEYHTYGICCFDVHIDDWVNEVPLMDLFIDMVEPDKRFRVAELGVLDDYLCVSTLINSTGVFWIMKEYGIKESWVKLFEFSHPSDSDPSHSYFTVPLGYLRGTKHEVLVRKEHESLCWHDIELGTYKEIVGLP